MTPIESIQFIQNKFDVKRWVIEDVPIWPFLRSRIGHQLSHQVYLGKVSAAPKRRKNIVSRLARAVTASAPQICADKTEALMIGDGTGYFRGKAGNFDNKNFRFLIGAHEKIHPGSTRSIDYASRPGNHHDDETLNLESWLDRQYLNASALEAIRLGRRDVYLSEYGLLLEFCGSLGIYVNDLELRRLSAFVRKWKYVKEAIRRNVADRLRPRVCYISTYYGFYGMAFVSAMREYGVAVVDVQHGLQGRSHYAYADWPEAAQWSYTQLPTHFLVWTSIDKSNLVRWADPESVFVLGIPFQETNSAAQTRDPSAPLKVLYSANQLEMEKRVGLLKRLSNLELSNMCFLIRVHPSEAGDLGTWNAYLKEKFTKNFELHSSSLSTLSTVIDEADINLSISSSVAIECNALGKPSILFGEYARPVLDEYDIGYFRYFDTDEELKRLLCAAASKERGYAEGSTGHLQTAERADSFVRLL
jgi:hypothetical protein